MRSSSVVPMPGSVAWATVALSAQEIRRSWWTRSAWMFLVVVGGAVVAAAVPRAPNFDPSSCLEWLALGLRASVKGIACTIALGAAGIRRPGPRRDGIGWLYAERGISESQRIRGQVAATCILIVGGLAVPWGGAALAFALMMRDVGVAGAALSVTAFSLVVGAILSVLSTVCAELFERRGRLAFIALLVGSWLLEELTGGRIKSLFGILERVLIVLMGAT